MHKRLEEKDIYDYNLRELKDEVDELADELDRAVQILKHIIEDYEDLDSHKITQISINEAKRFLSLMK